MTEKPILILAFNRPTHTKKLIDSLRPHKPQKILIGIDGPRKNSNTDKSKISQVIREFEKIDWTSNIEYRVRETNLGLRFAVADAVSWAISKHGEIIVLEDDVEIGPEFLSFMTEMLDRFKNDFTVGHISGYNLVPVSELSNPETKIRFSRIPESYAWATWERAWIHYEPNLNLVPKLSFSGISNLLQSKLVAAIWLMNFQDAKLELINTWAYRWIGTLWSHGFQCVSPNRNLVRYTGATEGTHTKTKPKWIELDVSEIMKLSDSPVELDKNADDWLQKNIFRGTMAGLFRRFSESLALRLLALLSRRF